MAIKKKNTRKNKSILGGRYSKEYYSFNDVENLSENILFTREVQDCPPPTENCNDECILIEMVKKDDKYHLTYVKTSDDGKRYAVISYNENDNTKHLIGYPSDQNFAIDGGSSKFKMVIFRKDPLELNGKFISFELTNTIYIYKYLVYAEKEKFNVMKFDPTDEEKLYIEFRNFYSRPYLPHNHENYNKLFQIKGAEITEIRNEKYKDLKE